MILTTTSHLQSQTVEAYLGIVNGNAILGANIVKDILASITDIIGGRSGAYEAEIEKAKIIAFEELQQKASALGADAVIGIDLDFETVGGGNMLMVNVCGTAVKLAPKSHD